MKNLTRLPSILSDLDRYFKELESYKIISEDQLKDSKTFFATSMLSFQTFNVIFDLCDQVISFKDLGIPSTYKDTFWTLERGNIISSSTRQKIWDIIKYRNVLAHEYGAITEKELFFIIQNLDTLKKFVQQMKKILI